MDMDASIILIRNIQTEMNMTLGMDATLENGIVAEDPFLIQLNVTDYTWDYIYLTIIAIGTLEIHDEEGNILNQNTLDKDGYYAPDEADGPYTSNGVKDIEIHKGTCSLTVQAAITYIDLSLSENYINDLSLILTGAIMVYIFSQPESQSELMTAFNSIINAIREQLSGWLTKPAGTF